MQNGEKKRKNTVVWVEHKKWLSCNVGVRMLPVLFMPRTLLWHSCAGIGIDYGPIRWYKYGVLACAGIGIDYGPVRWYKYGVLACSVY